MACHLENKLYAGQGSTAAVDTVQGEGQDSTVLVVDGGKADLDSLAEVQECLEDEEHSLVVQLVVRSGKVMAARIVLVVAVALEHMEVEDQLLRAQIFFY